ncbi:hypothetical protein ABZ470_23755 [Streptosporangium sp. NPDC020072]|uniref:hypothetical protein n=1 Tax=Streptosporangium sp. NPDC020072 TaxID=3154788 RepID=UPI00343A3DB3
MEDAIEIHHPISHVEWRFGERFGTFAYNPYNGHLRFHRFSQGHMVGKAHSIECARKIVSVLCAREYITIWIAPPDGDDHSDGFYEKHYMPESSIDGITVRHGLLSEDGRIFCKCGDCDMPESYRFRRFPCTLWCTGLLLS